MNNYMKTIISGLKQWVSAQINKSKSDWNQNDSNEINYVKNRTHYTYEKEIVFLPNTNLIEYDVEGIGESTVNLPSAIKVGQEYKVIFDGIEYSCVGYTNPNLSGAILLGNMNIIESLFGADCEDTGEPFFIGYMSTYDVSANTYIYTPTVDSHTIKITYMGEAVKKLDKKYLPDDILPDDIVTSVNGQTGDVNLTAIDVGALPNTTVIPSTVGLASQTYVDNKVATKQNKLTGKSGQVVGFDNNGNAVAQDAPSSVPDVTTTDNGKFLRVVDGAWAVTTVPNAEEVAF